MGSLKSITSHGEAPSGAVCVTWAKTDTTPGSSVPLAGASGCPALSVQLRAVHTSFAFYIHFQFLLHPFPTCPQTCTLHYFSLAVSFSSHSLKDTSSSHSLLCPLHWAAQLSQEVSETKRLRSAVRFCYLLVVVSSVLCLQWDKESSVGETQAVLTSHKKAVSQI